MSEAVFEFPLKEKVRNYLRIEQLLVQLKTGACVQTAPLHMYFFDQLFTLLDLLDRLDLRTDILKDLDTHERSLVYWSQHPNINSAALEQALQNILRLRTKLKNGKKFGSDLKDDKFLGSIRQRFAIPGGACSFDLPNLHFWLHQPLAERQKAIDNWLASLAVLEEAISISLAFLRERGTFQKQTAQNGFYQGVAEDKNELIRVRCQIDTGQYPNLSGNKYRYAIRFMWFDTQQPQNGSVDTDVTFSLAAC
ncbi:cell division protein ZapD [Alteromonas pelagimontana]|uniref:Cell division protein ZapD n=1 Tax=Alteromonas pelagimontana TaxID=1858656 RepID=A0A6M4MA28_9ALTE|nr:cell division protein ZapD [Alteromonas pelagimontana]QJR80013.1 cell division protein ZapD [Alteromonas pelagimontana]